MMFDKRKNVIANPARAWQSLACILVFLLLTACEEYSQRFEKEYEFGLSADRAPAFDGNSMTDYRDNITYTVRRVGNVWWMMDDLAHPFYTDDAYKETYCYKDKEGVCDEIGRLYPGEYLDYACPKGWRFPSLEEWTEFFNSKVFREYTPRHNGASDLYKGYVDGEHVLNGYGEDAYYWTNSHYFSDSYIDCVHYKRNTSSSGGIEPDYSSLSTAELCHEQWKLAVRCVKNADSELTTSSSSESRVSSSSESRESSSSRANIDVSFPCGDLWCGATDTLGRVNTGSEEPTSGYWYDCSDRGKNASHGEWCRLWTDYQGEGNGNSTFIYPSDVEINFWGSFYAPLIENYAGIKGTVVFGDGYDYPYAYLAFDLVDDSGGVMDISDWGGLCLVYQSEVGFSLQLVPENEDKVTGYNDYKATVSKSATLITVDIPWGKFKQESGWGNEADKSMVLSKTAIIRVLFQGTAGVIGDFYIRSIGRLGTCN